MDEDGGKRKDFFWIVIIAGVIIVTAGALFTGNYLARAFLGGGDSKKVSEHRADTDIINTIPDTVGVEGKSKRNSQEGTGRTDRAKDRTSKTGPQPTQQPGSEQKPAEDKKPAGSEIDITDVGTSSDEPAGAAQEKTDSSEDGKKETKPAGPAQETAHAEEPPPAAPEGNFIYVLQLGVYGNRENAMRMKKELETEYKLPVYVAEVAGEGEKKYRVQAGAFKDKANAEKLGRELQIKGYKYYISQQPAPQ